MDSTENEELLARGYQTTPIGLCVLDTELRFRHINEWLAAIHGVSVEEHMGRTIGEVIPDVARKVERQLRRVIGTGEPVLDGRVEASTLAFPHQKKIFQHSFIAIMSDTGDVVGVNCIVQDVTNRTVTETKLQENEAKYRSLIESTHAIPWEFDVATQLTTYVAPQVEKAFGYSPEEWCQKDFWRDHLHPDDRKKLMRSSLGCSAKVKDHEIEYRMITRDGRIVWIHDLVTVIQGPGGPERLRGVMIDITERKRNEALRAAQLRVLDLISRGDPLDNVLTALVHSIEQELSGIRCTVLLFDQADQCLQLGVGPSFPGGYLQALEGMEVGAEGPPCGLAAFLNEEQIVDNIQADPRCTRCAEITSQYNIHSCRSIPLRSRQGDVLGVFTVYPRDGHWPTKSDSPWIESVLRLAEIAIERQRTVDALKDSEERLELVVHGAGLGTWDWNVQTGQVLTNNRWAEILGYTHEEIHSDIDSWWDLIHPNDMPEVLNILTAHTDGRTASYEAEYRLRHKTGCWTWVLDKGRVIERETDGKPIRACGTLLDITERKRAERLQSDQAHVLELISQGTASLTEILKAIIKAAEDHSPDVRSTILLQEGNTLRHGAAINMPDSYNAQVDGVVIGPEVGSCGTAAYLKTRVIVEDIRTDPLWKDFRALGEEFDFRACWSQPIFDIHNTILGTFALYSRQPGRPTDYEIRFIESMAHLAGIAIERKRAEQALHAKADTERLLRQELNHRVRNILASLVSLIDLSRSGTESTTALAESIKGRVQSIAYVHSALSQPEWHPIELRTLMKTIMDSGIDAHIKLDGPDVIVPPEQAQAVCLVVHELLTNSHKYGALGHSEGCVEVVWKTHRDKSDNVQLLLHWVETGGPPIVTEPKPGTGMDLINGLVQSELHGHIEFGFPNQGADHTIAMTLQDATAFDFRTDSISK